MLKRTLFGQPSWLVRSPRVAAFVTETGGHLAPVTFDRRDRGIQPFSVAPWAMEETDPSLPTILKVLRGDFFCLPFGGNSTTFRGEKHPIHGETANARWRFVSLDRLPDRTQLHLRLRTRTRSGQVDKFIAVANDHDAVYQRHVISGMRGPISLGHHAMLAFPDEGGAGVISTSRFIFGQVAPKPVEQAENRGYSMLKPGAVFKSLKRVPTVTGGLADLTRYPARRGFEDIVLLAADPKLDFAWTAVTFPKQRYVWFALKDPKKLPSTLFWISNGGRHYPPWNGRHVNVMGLEEVCSYFHYGLAESVKPNPLSKRGIRTHVNLDGAAATVNYIMGTVAIPRGFDRVADIAAQGDQLILTAASGARVRSPVDVTFLQRPF
jgi:hypothetical protein